MLAGNGHHCCPIRQTQPLSLCSLRLFSHSSQTVFCLHIFGLQNFLYKIKVNRLQDFAISTEHVLSSTSVTAVATVQSIRFSVIGGGGECNKNRTIELRAINVLQNIIFENAFLGTVSWERQKNY